MSKSPNCRKIRYNNHGSIKAFFDESKKKEELTNKTYDETLKKLEFAYQSVCKYLELHPELQKYYPKIPPYEENDVAIIDFSKVQEERNNEMSEKEAALEKSLTSIMTGRRIC